MPQKKNTQMFFVSVVILGFVLWFLGQAMPKVDPTAWWVCFFGGGIASAWYFGLLNFGDQNGEIPSVACEEYVRLWWNQKKAHPSEELIFMSHTKVAFKNPHHVFCFERKETKSSQTSKYCLGVVVRYNLLKSAPDDIVFHDPSYEYSIMAGLTQKHQTQKIIFDWNPNYAGTPEEGYDSSHDMFAQREANKGVKRVEHISKRSDDKKGVTEEFEEKGKDEE